MAVVAKRQRKQPIFAQLLLILSLLNLSIKLASSWVHSPQSFRSSRFHSTPTLKMTSSTAANDFVCSETTQNAFRGKNILLTGASGGLGQALALQLAHAGVKTMVLSARSKDALERVKAECNEISSSTTIHVIPCDLSNPESVTSLGQQALKLCDVDVLINNGGVSSRSRFIDTKPEVDALVMQINFLSGASLAKAVAPGMVERKSGSIIWISSVQGLCKCLVMTVILCFVCRLVNGISTHSHSFTHMLQLTLGSSIVGLPERTSYAASKFAVQGYCEAMRGELASSGVTVHCASPGYIATNLSKSAITGDGSLHGKMDATTANGTFCVVMHSIVCATRR